jgi:hypothetical protein
VTPDADTASCMTSAHTCPRTVECWLWNKPAVPKQTYDDYPGGAECPAFIPTQPL